MGRVDADPPWRVVLRRRWLAAGVILGLMELAGGNIHLLLAAAIVLGFRWPWTWSLVLLTKITPGIGLLWFVVRREWRNLTIALGGTAAIAVSVRSPPPDAWFQWAEVLSWWPAATDVGRGCPSCSSCASRSRSRSPSPGPGPGGAGPCRSPGCWRCRHSGTAGCRCCLRSSRCGNVAPVRPSRGPVARPMAGVAST